MQVKQLAKDLKVDTDELLRFLRKMRIAVSDAEAELSDADMARVLARVEKEKRSGKEASEVIEAALEEASSKPRRRRRRRRVEPESEDAESDDTEGGDAESDADASGEEADEADAPDAEDVDEAED